MMAKSIFLIIFITLSYANSKIYWDLGIEIEKDTLNNLNKYNSKTIIKEMQSNFLIKPTLKTLSYLTTDLDTINQFNDNMTVSEISLLAKQLYIQENYNQLVTLIKNLNLNQIDPNNSYDLKYLLAHSLYKLKKYREAKDIINNLLINNKSERLYIIMAMICESMNENDIAKYYYQKLVTEFSNSDYYKSAKIKGRLLN